MRVPVLNSGVYNKGDGTYRKLRMEVSAPLGVPFSNPVFIVSICALVALAVLVGLRSDTWIDPIVFATAATVGVLNVYGVSCRGAIQLTPLLQYATSEDRAIAGGSCAEVNSKLLAGVTVSCAVGFIIYEAAVLG